MAERRKERPNLTSNSENQRTVVRDRFVVESPTFSADIDYFQDRVFDESPGDEMRGRVRG